MSASSDRHATILATLSMIGSAACWGGATVMSRDLLGHFSPPALLVIQLIASVLALLILSIPHRPWTHLSPALGKASLTGVLEPGLTYSIGLWGLSLTSAGSASIISSTEPIFIVFLAWLIFRNKPTSKLSLCILIAVVGLMFVSYDSALTEADKSLAGDMLIVLSTAFAASYVVFSSKLAEKFPAAVLASGQQVVGLLCALIIYSVARFFGTISENILNISPGVLIYAASSGVVQYALAFWLYLIGLKHLSPSAAGLWLTLVPVFGVVGAYFWLGEVPTPLMLLGMVLIVGAVTVGHQEK
ncbi:DMT family transporter [Verminephrobacter aporrectodeae subsp. tuberculatae]|uniref:DMT family transporter n=1 Tax=Verminephrobacter aporrectodeae TaxID=1110389 RepID=UPI00223797A5|nr:DMT family transporter [Verminephrobacter aporrectodeae]MCW5221358.1 DMT family transporter [Verminephrobacter aporrectodeae subsp. tuberculatae]MCW5290649.1 DMT family transporter [Verminephrobacter aporrectodeae subsp. tuberculatae]